MQGVFDTVLQSGQGGVICSLEEEDVHDKG